MSDGYKVLLRQKVKVHGERHHIELRKHTPTYYQLVNVYDNCEHDRGIPYTNMNDALRSFEGACGVRLTEQMEEYLMKK